MRIDSKRSNEEVILAVMLCCYFFWAEIAVYNNIGIASIDFERPEPGAHHH